MIESVMMLVLRICVFACLAILVTSAFVAALAVLQYLLARRREGGRRF